MGTASSLASELREPLVQHRILLPRPEVEVPPLVLVDGEAFGLHRMAERVAQPALLARAAEIPGVGAVAELVVAGRHAQRRAALRVAERQVDGAAAVVARALRR